MKTRFKSIDGALRQIRTLKAQIAEMKKLLDLLHETEREQGKALKLLAMLSAKTPQFDNPLEAMAAETLRDKILFAMGRS